MEVTSGQEATERQGFALLFGRVRGLVNTPRALYGAGPLEVGLSMDREGSAERAGGLEAVGHGECRHHR